MRTRRIDDRFTDSGDDGGGEEQRAGEFPLRSEAVRHELDDVGGDLLVLGLTDVITWYSVSVTMYSWYSVSLM